MKKWVRNNNWKVGRYLVEDEESGFVRYDDEVGKRWDGAYVQYRGNEGEAGRHPQEFVRTRDDPQPVAFANHPVSVSASAAAIDTCIGGTNISAPTGAARHLFNEVQPLLAESVRDALLQEDGECILLES